MASSACSFCWSCGNRFRDTDSQWWSAKVSHDTAAHWCGLEFSPLCSHDAVHVFEPGTTAEHYAVDTGKLQLGILGEARHIDCCSYDWHSSDTLSDQRTRYPSPR